MTASAGTKGKTYGSKGQKWSPEFISYMDFIVHHPNYFGMPDAVKPDGKIQWEAPSNRSSGQFQYTHQKRRVWWEQKAKSISIDTNANHWISTVAKLIHPTGKKPCKRCGKIMDISYAYPTVNLIKKFHKKFGENLEINSTSDIRTIVKEIFSRFGENQVSTISEILKSKQSQTPNFSSTTEVFEWLDTIFIKSEPTLLSPGAMSNAPDRFDGFHSFNRCCRSKADKGRNAKNLKSYVTDRRVFEFWSDGDWITADRLMGLVRTKFSHENCEDGGNGPPSADHIGPISLGFKHQPYFRLLSQTANSSKNNRMTLSDVQFLKEIENKGEKVASWYAEPLWNSRKDSVCNNETALRLSKALRDNQRVAMKMLAHLYQNNKLLFLIYLLNLHFAEREPLFINLRAENFITTYDEISYKKRITKYVLQQKARRIRIGIKALQTYIEKENRHDFYDFNNFEKSIILEAEEKIDRTLNSLQKLENTIKFAVNSTNQEVSEKQLRSIAAQIPNGKMEDYEIIIRLLKRAMGSVAERISKNWSDDRYTRE